MEKRFLFAFFISFLFITIYSILRTPHQSDFFKKEPASLALEKNFYTRPEQMVLSKEQATPSLRANELNIEEKEEQIETDKIIVHFSNIGGKLKNFSLKEYNHSLPITNMINFQQDENIIFHSEQSSPNSIIYSFIENGTTIVKKYTVSSQQEYLIRLDISVNKKKFFKMSNNKYFTAFSIDFSQLNNKKYSSAEQTLFEYSIFTKDQMIRKANLIKFSQKNDIEKILPVKWVGFRDRYFCLIIQPEFSIKGYTTQTVTEQKLNINLDFEEILMQEHEDLNFKYNIYVGPQQASILNQYDPTFTEIISFNNIGLFDFIAKGIHSLIVMLHKIIPNWGICIIFTSVFIYLLTYPFTVKSITAMKKIQIIQPKISKLREQHKNNPQKLNKETMELYKEQNINPLAGCLPMICQIPIFIGLYQVLWRSIIFRGEGFLWIKDLSEPDRLFTFPSQLPFIGHELNILPVLMSLLMFFQQKMSIQNVPLSDPAQAAQQKMMTTFFPILLGFFLYRFASGVSLYFTVSYFLSFLTQWKLSQKIK